MITNYKKYIEEYITNESTRKHTDYIFRRIMIGFSPKTIEDVLVDFDEGNFVDGIKKSSPNGKQVTSNIISALKNYAYYLNDNGYNTSKAIMFFGTPNLSKKIWEAVESDAKKPKYISEHDFEKFMEDIIDYESKESSYENGLIICTMFRCLWEGVFDGDLTLFSNLRASDIDDNNVITLNYSDGGRHRIKISEKLAEDLRKCSKIDTWTTKNRYTIYDNPTQGKEFDSCFKITIRNNQSVDMVKHNYYKRMSKAAANNLGRTIKPKNIVYSGIVARCMKEFEKNDIDFVEYITQPNTLTSEEFNKGNSIFSIELIRCNIIFDVSKLRAYISERLEEFV